MLPYCTANFTLSRAPSGNEAFDSGGLDLSIYLGVLYTLLGFIMIPLAMLVLSVFNQPLLFKHSCYKLMALTTVLDIVNLINGMWISGMFALLRIHHCSHGVWVAHYSQFLALVWYMYSVTSEILAFNRLLEFSNRKLALFLFDGKRTYLWLLLVFGYPILCSKLVPDAFYHYNPYIGAYYLFRVNGEPNVVHIINNFFKFGFITVCYSVMLIQIFVLKRSSQWSPLEIKVSIQLLVIAVLADGASLGYIAAAYLPLSPSMAKYASTFGQFLWFFVHGGSTIIYIVMNRNVNQRFRKIVSTRLLARNGVVRVSNAVKGIASVT